MNVIEPKKGVLNLTLICLELRFTYELSVPFFKRDNSHCGLISTLCCASIVLAALCNNYSLVDRFTVDSTTVSYR